VNVVELTEVEGATLFDRAARRDLGITGAEFLARWDRGDYAGAEDPAAEGVAMLIPFAR
jgi:hypothetical protein